MTVRGYIELEWRVPWPADWSMEKKRRAAEKLASYLVEGTVFDAERRRLPITHIEVKPAFEGLPGSAIPNESPYIVYRLEV